VWSNFGNYCRSNLEQHAIFSFHQRHSETGWHNIIRSGPNFIPRNLCLYICRWNLPQPNRTKFTNVDVEVKNKMTHLYNTIKHATTSQASWSLLKFLLYSERQQASPFCRWSADHYYLSISRVMIQFKKWSNLRGLPLHCLSCVSCARYMCCSSHSPWF
jgi:hypothetical protein